MLATSPPGDSRLFVVEQDGAIRIVDHGLLLPTPFLDINGDAANVSCNSLTTEADCLARVDCLATHTVQGKYSACRNFVDGGSGSELGLLGLAFHPQFATNHKFYVFLTLPNPIVSGTDPTANGVFEFTATSGTTADPTTRKPILVIPDFANNHNAGMIEFGADGYLYISTGDGGGAGDPRRNGQNTHALLGKMLRIDVDNPSGANAYGIPADNPFADGVDGAPEVFMYGLRNPWRWSFDRANGDMWIADVGQQVIEEVDYVPAGQQAGKNFGWSAYEGSQCCMQETSACNQSPADQPCDPTGVTFPQIEHAHSTGWNAIIGGQVYRGPCYPDLTGTYFYTDHGKQGLAAATVSGGTVTTQDLPGTWPKVPSSLHADAAGELYLTTTQGLVLHLEAGP